MINHITLTQFIIEKQREFPDVSGDFTLLLNDIMTACKKISHLVNRGNLIDVLGNADTENVQGEVQKKLDIITDYIWPGAPLIPRRWRFGMQSKR